MSDTFYLALTTQTETTVKLQVNIKIKKLKDKQTLLKLLEILKLAQPRSCSPCGYRQVIVGLDENF